MMSAQLIHDISDVAAWRAAEEGREPLSIWSRRDPTHIPFLGDYTPAGWRHALWSDFVTNPRVGYPWREDEEAYFMVDSSGFGDTSEPALTVEEFKDFVTDPDAKRPQNDYGWGIRESGEFQVVVGAYIADPTSPGNPAPDEDDVICKECYTVHDGMEECDVDGLQEHCKHESVSTTDEPEAPVFGSPVHRVSICRDCGADSRDHEYIGRCPACGDVIDYCQGHGESGDPAGFAILAAHDDDDHSECHPDGCEEAPRA